MLEVAPLAPDAWPYFALDDVVYHGRRLSILWDQDGTRYRRGAGLRLLVDGQTVASSPRLERLTAQLPPRPKQNTGPRSTTTLVNFAVNNDGTYFPRIGATHTGDKSSAVKLIDGNYWYHVDPPNRWTAAGSPNEHDWVEIDFGTPRKIHTVKLYLLDDGDGIVPPRKFEVESWQGDAWQPIPEQQRTPQRPTGRRANVVRIPTTAISKLRIMLDHAPGQRSGLTEIEAWGDAILPVEAAPAPAGNLAYNPGDKPFPQASASLTSRFDKIEMVNDGRIVYAPNPANRWTAYESKSATDWLQIDFGSVQEVGRVDLHIYDDRGGVQPPASYGVEYLEGDDWRPVAHPQKSPDKPTGGVQNTVRFDPVKTAKLRVVFTHQGASRSGLTEIEIWKK